MEKKMEQKIIKVATNMTMSYELITPEVAQELKHNMRNNRKISEGTVIAYMNDIKNGQWDTSTSNAIAIDEDGKMIDGQHRCEAIIRTGAAMPMWICRNVSRNGIYDNNRKRSTSDQIQITCPELENIYKNTRYISIVRAILVGNRDRRTVTPREVIRFTKKHKKDLDGFFFNISQQSVKKISIAVVHLGMFTAYMSGVSMENLSEFYDILCTGMSTQEHAFPVIAYRNYLLTVSSTPFTTNTELGRCQYAISKFIEKSHIRRSISPKDLIYPIPFQNEENEEENKKADK